MEFVFEKNASFSFMDQKIFSKVFSIGAFKHYFKNFKIFKAIKIYTFFVIKDQVIHHKIDDRMLSQKNYIAFI